MENDLLPCPFCGCDAESVHIFAGENVIRCTNVKCLVAPVISDLTHDAGRERWNTRETTDASNRQEPTYLDGLMKAAEMCGKFEDECRADSEKFWTGSVSQRRKSMADGANKCADAIRAEAEKEKP